jgi:hypothetical protein
VRSDQIGKNGTVSEKKQGGITPARSRPASPTWADARKFRFKRKFCFARKTRSLRSVQQTAQPARRPATKRAAQRVEKLARRPASPTEGVPWARRPVDAARLARGSFGQLCGKLAIRAVPRCERRQNIACFRGRFEQKITKRRVAGKLAVRRFHTRAKPIERRTLQPGSYKKRGLTNTLPKIYLQCILHMQLKLRSGFEKPNASHSRKLQHSSRLQLRIQQHFPCCCRSLPRNTTRA